jgi:hypothetical protein
MKNEPAQNKGEDGEENEGEDEDGKEEVED